MKTTPTQGNRWLVASTGTLLQLCLGTVYAWSYFQKPIMERFGWSNSQTAWTFSIAIGALGLAAAWGGMNLAKYGPRRLARIGSILFSAGYLIGALAFALKSLVLLYVGYGIIGGIGLGLSYVTPVATVAKWFPGKKGLVTGMVTMGFGFGALFMSKLVAPVFMALAGGDLVFVFLGIGVLMAVLTFSAASFLRNPGSDDATQGSSGRASPAGKGAEPAQVSFREIRGAIFSTRFGIMWLVFFLNITAGIMFIGFQSPMIQDMVHAQDPDKSAAELAGVGATLIAISSMFNGFGRLFWGGLSDRIGRTRVFRIILGSQVLVFVGLLFVRSPVVFGMLVCYVLLCYGGGFGTMPSYVTLVFGPRLMAVVYGAMLTAWSAGGIVGPQIVAFIKDRRAGGELDFCHRGGAVGAGFRAFVFAE